VAILQGHIVGLNAYDRLPLRELLDRWIQVQRRLLG
jgi:hypothetical protein